MAKSEMVRHDLIVREPRPTFVVGLGLFFIHLPDYYWGKEKCDFPDERGTNDGQGGEDAGTTRMARNSVPFRTACNLRRTPMLRLFTLSLGLSLALFQSNRAMADNQSLHVLLVIDTNAGKRGGDLDLHREFAEGNLRMWQTLLNGLYNSGPLFKGRLTISVLKDGGVSPANIRQHIKNLPFKRDQALLFFYSGHGGIGAKGQYFATSAGDIARSEVRQLMTDRGAPAVFILSDCCSSYGHMTEESIGEIATKSRKTPNSHAFYELFYKTQGYVEITAAEPGKVAYLGFFTTAATSWLYEPNQNIRYDRTNGPVTWNEYFGRVYQTTGMLFTNSRNGAHGE